MVDLGAQPRPVAVFTQRDVNDSTIRYQHNGEENFEDFFQFALSDGINQQMAAGTVRLLIKPVQDLAPYR